MARRSREAQIMDAALAVFVEYGYDGARIRHIAQRAGVSDGALYAHHRSKEALALELFRRHVTRYAGALREAVAAAGPAPAQRIAAVAGTTLEAFAAEPHAVGFVITHQPRFIAELEADFPYPIRVVERVIEQGQREGSIRAGPVRLLTALVFGCITQPIRTVLEAPPGTIEIGSQPARALVAEAAWRAIAA